MRYETIDVKTAEELNKKGVLKFMGIAGINNYVAVYDHKHYALVREENKTYYELLTNGKR